MGILGVWPHEERDEEESHVRETERVYPSGTYSISGFWTQQLVTYVDGGIPRHYALERISEMAGLLNTPIFAFTAPYSGRIWGTFNCPLVCLFNMRSRKE